MTPTRAKIVMARAPAGAADVITDDGAWSDDVAVWLVENSYAVPTGIELTTSGKALRDAVAFNTEED